MSTILVGRKAPDFTTAAVLANGEINGQFNLHKEIEKKYEIKLIGYGASMMSSIKEITLHFIDNKPQTIDQSREKIVQITSELISAFNSDLEIRPFLSNYPFNSEHFYITISFEKKGKYLDDSISYVSKRKKIIDYCVYNEKEKKLVEMLEENYEEAQQKAQLGTDKSHLSQAI